MADATNTAAGAAPGTYYRRGLGLKAEVQPVLQSEYGSALVLAIKAADYSLEVNRFRFRLARSLGFCYGVDRAVEYAYETCRKFPDRDIYLVGEIIHNPHVNRQLRAMGVHFLYPDPEGRFDFSALASGDVVIIPAFGVKLEDFQTLRESGAAVVDTTCGSVLNVWKRVEAYAREGFTALIHGKHWHEETRATSSQVRKHPDGKYVIVRDMEEAERVCAFVEGKIGPGELMAMLESRCSDNFDPERDLGRIGVANQTTMLASESLAIAHRVGEAIAARYGDEEMPDRFRSFDTICSATQDRQDAIEEMMRDPPDIMVVVGGYNSSNTNHLAHLCAQHTRTFHIETAGCIDSEAGTISHKEIMGERVHVERDWLPGGEVAVGLTAGASTPDSLIGDTVERILRQGGCDPAAVLDGMAV